MKALRKITMGLLLETSSGKNSPPAEVMSATRRPARETTTVRWPASASMRTSSTAPASAAPPSSVGTTMSTTIGVCGAADMRAALSDGMLSASTAGCLSEIGNEDAGRLDIYSTSKYRRLPSAYGERFDAPHANSEV